MRTRIRTLQKIAYEIYENWRCAEPQSSLWKLKRQIEGNHPDECQDDKIYLVCAAAYLAKELHKGQVDKAGKDYFEGHLLTVGCNGCDWKEKTVGFLHDVLEDTDYTSEEIIFALMRTLNGWEILTESEREEIKRSP